MNLLESLNWRYAAKRMNGQVVPQEKVETIIEAARLAPTSVGMQPFHIIMIKDADLLQKIQPIANNQPQITEGSHLLVFAAWDTITEEKIEENFTRTAKERGMPVSSLDGFKNSVKSLFAARTDEENFQWAARQAYIAFGFALVAAATEQVDATPMEGFNAAALDEFLGLREKGLRSVTILPLGYRDTENDWLQPLKKVRLPKEELVTEFN